ncbi:MAG: hypothetical protein V3V13_13860 [Paracoccaceae bacterium]
MLDFLRASFREFVKDECATITLEFVVILPLLVFWFIGSIVFFDAFKKRGQVVYANSTIADIVSRYLRMHTNEIDQLQLLQTALLPRTSGGWLRITSLQFLEHDIDDDDDDEYIVIWSQVTGVGHRPIENADDDLDDDDVLLPIEILPNMYDSEQVMLVESHVPYIPIADWVGITAKTWRDRVVISPRKRDRVVWAPES